MATAMLLIFLIPNQVKAGQGDDLLANAAIETVDADAAIAAENEALLFGHPTVDHSFSLALSKLS